MATTIAAKGDLLAGTANDAYSALTIGANDTVLTADSSAATGLKWAAVSGGYSNYEVFTSSTTWTVPAGITKCAYYVVGGGAGGSSGDVRIASFQIEGGGGGGGGGIAYDPFYTVTPAAAITVTIGAGGSGAAVISLNSNNSTGNIGNGGVASSFDSNSAAGGNVAGNNTSGGSGGSTLGRSLIQKTGGVGGTGGAVDIIDAKFLMFKMGFIKQ
jgi:hypothetical protein